MGIAERREREKEQRRNDIIDAAEKIFLSRGWESATMDDVATEAELSKGTLYLYFKSKEDLYLAINARGFRIMVEMFQNAILSVPTGIEKIEAIGKAFHSFSEQYPEYFDAMLIYETKDIDFIENECASECDFYGQQALTIVAQAIQVGMEDGTIRKDLEPLKTSIILWGHSTGLIQVLHKKGNHLEDMHQVDLSAILDYSFELIKRSLTP